MVSHVYREWQRASARVHDQHFFVATKPGLFAHGQRDVPAMLLAERAVVAPGDVVAYVNCGSGLFGAVAARRGGARHVVLTDRHVVSAEAARRTIALNDVTGATVALQHGLTDLVADDSADVVAIRLPSARLPMLLLVHEAFRVLRLGGRCYLAGATDEGAKAAVHAMETLFGGATVLWSGGGCRIASATKHGNIVDSNDECTNAYERADAFHQIPLSVRGIDYVLSTRPGVFSWEHVDEATQLLAEVMDVRPGEAVLDLGCGAGALGLVAGTRNNHARVCLVDADIEAVRCAARTVSAHRLTNATVVASDITDAVRNERFDVVVSNPPFHVGKQTALNVPLEFLRQARDVLLPGGRLIVVANRTLPYERALAAMFAHVRVAVDGARFKVLEATTSPNAP